MDKFIVKRGRVESVDDGESSPPYAQSAVVTTDNVQATSCKTIVPVGTYCNTIFILHVSRTKTCP